MPDYSKGKIYRIVCNETGEQYIGSTTESLSRRLSGHKRRGDCTSSQIIERGNYKIVLIEECACDNKEQLNRRERHFIETMECVNRNIPTRTYAEWHRAYREANREEIAERDRAYYEANYEKILEQKRAYYEANRDEIAERRRAYREVNYEKILEKQRAYEEANREKILERKRAYRAAKKALANLEND